jgi:hypothetical protein
MTSEAADALRRFMEEEGWDHGLSLFDEALEAERARTIHRIRDRLADNHNALGAEHYRLDQIEELLDEVGS